MPITPHVVAAWDNQTKSQPSSKKSSIIAFHVFSGEEELSMWSNIFPGTYVAPLCNSYLHFSCKMH